MTDVPITPIDDNDLTSQRNKIAQEILNNSQTHAEIDKLDDISRMTVDPIIESRLDVLIHRIVVVDEKTGEVVRRFEVIQKPLDPTTTPTHSVIAKDILEGIASHLGVHCGRWTLQYVGRETPLSDSGMAFRQYVTAGQELFVKVIRDS